MPKQIGKFLVAVGAIIENTRNGKILLLERSKEKDFSPGIWEYITGRLNQFEDPIAGLRREIKEESGLKTKIIKPLSVFHIFRGEKTAKNELVGIMFWCQTNSQKVKLSREHSEFRWVTPQNALRLVKKPSMRQDIKAFVKEKNK